MLKTIPVQNTRSKFMTNKYFKLNNSNKVPIVGIGTWEADKNKVATAIKYAILKCNYRHIDCAAIYGNEKQIGEAFERILTTSKIKRNDLFITSKLWNNRHNPELVEKTCRQTLKDLHLKYLDLYLMHWGIAFKPEGNPEPIGKNGKVQTADVPILDTWRAMENLVKKGLAKSIGVANFTTIMLVDLLTSAKIKPVMNQVELHPYNTQEQLIEYCKYRNITVTAYSPLGRGSIISTKNQLLKDKVIQKIAKSHHKTPAQILINWAISRGTIPIPKSTSPKRIAENIAVFDFELTNQEMQEINKLNKNYRLVDPSQWWCLPYFS